MAWKGAVRRAVNALGYDLVRRGAEDRLNLAVEITAEEAALIHGIRDAGLTMTSLPRLLATLTACKYVVENAIPGDFVECGVWRGGHGILAKQVFERLGDGRAVWMYDTFEGMTAPGAVDVSARTGVAARARYDRTRRDASSDWCRATLEDVQANVRRAGIDPGGVRYVKGDVCATLRAAVSVLRLDTDWYDSTRAEMEVLYPRLAPRGVLLLDDYGHWDGARKAVDGYFAEQAYRPLFHAVDLSGRVAIKL